MNNALKNKNNVVYKTRYHDFSTEVDKSNFSITLKIEMFL